MGVTIAENNRRWRRNNPEAARVLAKRSQARDAAARRVAALHRAEFERFYADECAKRDVTPYSLAPESVRAGVNGGGSTPHPEPSPSSK